jgi:hypothetical protein
MKAAETIAQRLYGAGVRFDGEYERDALLKMPEHLRSWVVSEYLRSINHDDMAMVDLRLVYQHGWEAAGIDAVFDKLQGDEFSEEVDAALWSIQRQDIEEKRAESRLEHRSDAA